RASERILVTEQEVELFRRQQDAAVRRAKLEADSAVAQAKSVGQRQIEEMKVELQKLKNQSDVIVGAEVSRTAAEIAAEGQAAAVEIVQGAHNELLRQKVELLTTTGDAGKIALFIAQLPKLFEAYQLYATDQKVENLLVLNEADGFNAAVNRGPAAFVDFLHQLDEGFGISVKGLLSGTAAQPAPVALAAKEA
ncbi:MAG: flotillin, partial [Chloroflexota bacterium]|nr:flotillin [Chloroflexota bacterium]